MALIFTKNHASDLSEWGTTVVDSGDLAHSATNGPDGDSGIASFTIDDTTAIYLQEGSLTPTGNNVYRYQFWFRDISLAFGAGEGFEVVWCHASGVRRHTLSFQDVSGVKKLRVRLAPDGGTPPTDVDVNLGGSSDWIGYEVVVTRATSNVASDASCVVYQHTDTNYASPIVNITGIDLYDDFPTTFNAFRIGANIGIDAGTSGVFYIDRVTLRSDATEIGWINTDPVLTVPGAQRYVIGVAEVISGISFTDADDDESVMTFTCNQGTFAAPTPTGVDVSGSGTSTMTLTGTRTEINAYCAAGNGPTYTHTTDNHTADTITVNIDDQVGTPDEETIAVTAITARGTADNMADLNGLFRNLTATEANAKTVSMTVHVRDSGGRTDTAVATLTFAEAISPSASIPFLRRRRK